MTVTPYELKLARYTGPLEKLLELIEARSLEITEISLAEVTDDFLAYLERLKQEQEGAANERESLVLLRIVADFVVVASRLLFIKSKALLPDVTLGEEEEADIKDLELRLQMMREFRPAQKFMLARWTGTEHAWSRPYFMNTVSPLEARRGAEVFYPGSQLNINALTGSLATLFSAFERFVMESDTIKETVVSLEKKIQEVMRRFREITEASFSALAGGSSRGERVVAFLAILHLAREQIVRLEQDAEFSDIMIRRAADGPTATAP
jgi:segregation and condensation protein A